MRAGGRAGGGGRSRARRNSPWLLNILAGALVLAEMTSEGSLARSEYTAWSIALERLHKGFVISSVAHAPLPRPLAAPLTKIECGGGTIR